MTNPLFRDDVLQNRETQRFDLRLGRLLKWFIPRFAFRPSPSRKSVLWQLGLRSQADLEGWRAFGNYSRIEQILKLFKDQLSLPNHYLVPSDPLSILLESGLDIDATYLFLELRDRFQAKFEDSEIDDWCLRGMSLGEFVRIIVTRSIHSPIQTSGPSTASGN